MDFCEEQIAAIPKTKSFIYKLRVYIAFNEPYLLIQWAYRPKLTSPQKLYLSLLPSRLCFCRRKHDSPLDSPLSVSLSVIIESVEVRYPFSLLFVYSRDQ